MDSDVSIIKIIKFSNILLSKIKENSIWLKNFFCITGSEAEYFSQIKSENIKQPFLQILQFFCEVIDVPVRNISSHSPSSFSISNRDYAYSDVQRSVRSYSSIGDDEYHRLIEESDTLAKTISHQKAKIAQICEKVKYSIGRSGNRAESSLAVRPYSSISRYERPYSVSPHIVNYPIIEVTEKDKTP